jgi:hypothetical protein
MPTEDELTASRPKLAFGDQVRSAVTGELAIVLKLELRNGEWFLSVVTKATGDVIHDSDPRFWQLVRKNPPYMARSEWEKRSRNRASGPLSNERQLGRLEGQLMASESALLRLTGLRLSSDAVTEMLGAEIETYEMLIEHVLERLKAGAVDIF